VGGKTFCQPGGGSVHKEVTRGIFLVEKNKGKGGVQGKDPRGIIDSK